MSSHVSPKGFLSAHGVENPEFFRTLWIEIRGTPKDRIPWDLVVKGVSEASRYFGDIHQWLKMQLEGPYLYGRRADFLKDTLVYVETGMRTVSIHNWGDLLDNNPETRSTPPDVAAACMRHIPMGLSTAAYLSRWCAHPNGFVDMICTLNTLILSGSETESM